MLEWILENTWAIWLTLGVLFLVLETISTDLFWIMLAGGSGGALVAALFGIPLGVEIGIFIAVSVILVWALRPIALKHMTVSPEDSKDIGVGSYPGREAVATQALTKESGLVRFDGQIWSARTTSREISEGESVIIEKVAGAILWVRPETESNQIVEH